MKRPALRSVLWLILLWMPRLLPAQTTGGPPLAWPWAGGMNASQYCPIDLNLDGREDMLVFERHGNVAMTFLNGGTSSTFDYTFDPSFARLLPEMHDWVIAADYDCDGRKDLFTCGNGGIRVFRNISDTVLKFKLVTNLLESFYYTGKIGILGTPVDYPAIADIDGDGDLDLLTFFGLGSWVEFHRNLSMERYGICDSLDFKMSDPCWGKFRESSSGNAITLNDPCGFDRPADPGTLAPLATRHTGSTLLATDLNGDGLTDLIIGDVDYPGLVALYNGGTKDSAFMVSQDSIFPSADPVQLFSFPAAFLADIDNDGRRDLLVSPFDPALYIAENRHCIRYYHNIGTEQQPQFLKIQGEPFRSGMADFGSASHPVLYDFDGDGLQDLIVGNYGTYDSSWYFQGVLRSQFTSSISYFRNTGTATDPVFIFTPTEGLGLPATAGLQGLFPAPGDVDGDGRTDLVTGCSDGTLLFFRNLGGTPLTFAPPVRNWQQISAGAKSAPQLFDLDRDGAADLILGGQDGRLRWYRNTGTAANPHFVKVTDTLGGVSTVDPGFSPDGYSTPCFRRMPDDTTILLAGSCDGRIRYYTNIDGNLAGRFTETAGLYNWLSANPADSLFGRYTSPTLGHLTDPLEFDMVTGEFQGGLLYITKRTPATVVTGIGSHIPPATGNLNIVPNPADATATISLHNAGSGAPAPATLFDLRGTPVLHLLIGGKTTIDVHSLNPGIYLLRCGALVSRLVVIHR